MCKLRIRVWPTFKTTDYMAESKEQVGDESVNKSGFRSEAPVKQISALKIEGVVAQVNLFLFSITKGSYICISIPSPSTIPI